MATIRVPILNAQAQPDGTGECWFEPYSILATNDVWRHLVGRFGSSNAAQPTVRHGFYGTFVVPKDYVGQAKVIPYWTATITTGNVVWDFEYRTVGGDDTTSLDQAGTEESLTITDATPGAANRLLIPAGFTLTAANFTADEIVEFYFARDGVDANDTAAGSAIVHALLFEYVNV